jgi:hypothetical protein
MALMLCVLAGVLFIHARSPGRWIVLAGALIFSAALVLPPGWNQTLIDLLEWMRSVAAISVALLVMLYGVQWAGLREARQGPAPAGG